METPTISNTAYASNAVSLMETFGDVASSAPFGRTHHHLEPPTSTTRRIMLGQTSHHTIVDQLVAAAEEQLMARKLRIVQIFIVDPNENVSLEDCLLFKSEPKMTDLENNELFFELDIKDILAKHNEKRVKLVNKLVKDRVEYLEPAKIRDLKMNVVDIATF